MKKDVSVVTGAGSGFGLLTSIELARRGHRVFATMRDPSRSERLDAAARKAGVKLEKLQLDVTRPLSIASAIQEITDLAGRIDVLVNNAGFALGGLFEDLTLDELRDQFETNFFGLAAVTQAVLPGMRDRRYGRIINVSSASGRLAKPGLSAYGSSKWAIEGLSEALRHELRPHGVWVVLIEPGTFKTDIFDRNRRVAKRALDPHSPNYETTQRTIGLLTRSLERNTADPAEVARVIGRAATAPRPKLRYVVGRDAKAEVMLKLMPFSLVERAVDRYLGR
jgi:NAD(P)-dependent dehydrogenase (short-subunit alcohol dehydrogenase family)